MSERSFFSQNPENGFIYVLSNPSMPGLLKIGFSIRNVAERVAELSSSTGIPSDFVFEALFASPAAQEDEYRIHEALSAYRQGTKEFFRIRPGEAIRKIMQVIGYEPLEVRYAVSKKGGAEGLFAEAAANLRKHRL